MVGLLQILIDVKSNLYNDQKLNKRLVTDTN